jgi:hypothetical protein
MGCSDIQIATAEVIDFLNSFSAEVPLQQERNGSPRTCCYLSERTLPYNPGRSQERIRTFYSQALQASPSLEG